MRFYKQFEIGLNSYGKACSFLYRHGLWWYFAFPVLLNVLLFIGGFAFFGQLSEWGQEWILSGLVDKETGILGSEWFKWLLTAFIWITFRIVFFVVFAYIGGYVVLILLSPILAILSQQAETISTGREYSFNADQLMRDTVRAGLIALRNLIIQLAYMMVLWIISFIPVIGLLSPLAIFIVSSYFYGFSFMDYTNERRKLSIKESITYIRTYRGVAIGNGMLFSLLLLIPFVGPSLAGFAAIISVTGASLAMQEVEAFRPEGSIYPFPQR